jgi:hypothetical protein
MIVSILCVRGCVVCGGAGVCGVRWGGCVWWSVGNEELDGGLERLFGKGMSFLRVRAAGQLTGQPETAKEGGIRRKGVSTKQAELCGEGGGASHDFGESGFGEDESRQILQTKVGRFHI